MAGVGLKYRPLLGKENLGRGGIKILTSLGKRKPWEGWDYNLHPSERKPWEGWDLKFPNPQKNFRRGRGTQEVITDVGGATFVNITNLGRCRGSKEVVE